RRALELDPELTSARTNLEQIEEALEARSRPKEGRDRSRRRVRELGIRFDSTDFSYLGIEGAIVDAVKERSPADRGGLREGDIILGVDGQKIEGPQGFLKYVYEEAPGETVQVDVLRDNRPRRLVIEIR
ncbi:MAG: PDZ domain-containing protein, partial [Thermoanaerobaculia bacterium]|nr:PDZ domain-containing protein [Thermoanaerobaculia bacterium]